DLAYYYGPCEVVEVALPRGARILPEHLPGPVSTARVLFKTGSFPDPARFDRDFHRRSPELVHAPHARRADLIRLDTPSVDPFDDARLESHQALARHDMANLEGVVLAHVAPGRYTLAAFPLRLERGDASPVRAVLIAS